MPRDDHDATAPQPGGRAPRCTLVGTACSPPGQSLVAAPAPRRSRLLTANNQQGSQDGHFCQPPALNLASDRYFTVPGPASAGPFRRIGAFPAS